MPEYKEKKIKKARPPGAARPRQAARQMKEKYIRELKQAPEDTDHGSGYATEQIEGAGRWAVDELAGSAGPSKRSRKLKNGPMEKHSVTEEQPDSPAQPMEDPPPQANAPKERKDRVKQAGADSGSAGRPALSPDKQGVSDRPKSIQAPGHFLASSHTNRDGAPPGDLSLNNRRRGPAAFRQSTPTRGQGAGHSTSVNGAASPRTGRVPKGRTRPELKTRSWTKRNPGPGPRSVPAKVPIPHMAAGTGQAARQQIKQQAIQTVQKGGKGLFALTKKLAAATTRAVAALVNSVAVLAGGGVLLAAVVIIMVIGAVASSPFGLFFAQERNAPGTLSVAEAVNEVNIDYNARLEALQTGDYDDIVIHGQAADWAEVLAVFASRYAGAENGVDVATLDPDRVDRLTATFWDMTAISSRVETIEHPGSEDSEGWTEYILHITIAARTADDMRAYYAFTGYQNSALDELLANRAAFSALAGSLSITNADARAVLADLPADLSPERRAVVETALKLYGKVTYFWGGKSLVLGWDARWGQLRKVTAAGSSTTGTYRPYGLDCSGFVDWAFYNATGGDYIIGHGGGAHAQHTYCDPISWDEAIPGDLVFYPEDSHVGIVCGKGENGELLVIHCASGANNVVITGISGFTSVARPVFYYQ